MDDAFWNALDILIATSEIVIDRPRGSAHPRYTDIIYPLDYGYLTDTSGSDGSEIDIWRGSLPEGCLDAVVCTVDSHKRDAEVKLLIGCSAQERQTIYNFHQGCGVGATLVERRTTE